MIGESNKKRKKVNNQNSKQKRTNTKIGKTKENTKKINKKVKIIGIIIILILIIFLILTSGLFSIKNIVVTQNDKITSEKIISFSGIKLGENIFKFNIEDAEKKVLENSYINKATITRKLPSTIEIKVEERIPKYMLQFADSYVYINNQGYMLEISNTKLDLPILVGLTTDLSNIKAGNRLNKKDLEKMKMVIKIYEVAKNHEIEDIISKIDISNTKNYTIYIDSQNKIAYLGDCEDLNTKISYLKNILSKSVGQSGEIFVNMDLNNDEAYFRERIN